VKSGMLDAALVQTGFYPAIDRKLTLRWICRSMLENGP